MPRFLPLQFFIIFVIFTLVYAQESRIEAKKSYNVSEAVSLLKTNQILGIEILHDLALKSESYQAMYQLGKVYQTSKYNIFNVESSQYWFLKSAYGGNPDAKFEVAFLYSKNMIRQSILDKVHSEVDRPILDLKKMDHNAIALINYLSSAFDGNVASKMMMGYKFLKGYGVTKDCKKAAKFYQSAALVTIGLFDLGSSPFVDKQKLEDEESSSTKQSIQEVMEYYRYNADKGMTNAQLVMGYAFLYGIRGVEQDTTMALHYLEKAAEGGEGEAYGPLGNIYSKGIGVPRDVERAIASYKKGIELEDSYSHAGMGYLHYHGIGVEKDYLKAFKHFNASSSKGNPEGQYYYGLCWLNGHGTLANVKNAFNLFTASAAQQNVLSFYQLGVMASKGLGTTYDCPTAVKFFKSVSEKGSMASLLDEGYNAYTDGNERDALLYYAQTAEIGIEIAQLNMAYMLDREIGFDYLTEIQENATFVETAFYYDYLLAEQGNVNSLVKVGDHYYYGLGTTVNIDKSLENYRKASDLRNPQAMFNLGYMHEHGEGLTKDYYLAKRYYDLAKETSKDAYVPVNLAMIILYAKWGYQMIWNEELRAGLVLPNFVEIYRTYEDLILMGLVGFFSLLLFVRFFVFNARRIQVINQ